MNNSFNLQAEKRENIGSAHSRRARKEGKIPAIIEGRGKGNICINVNSREFEREYAKGDIFTTMIELELDGKKVQVVPNKISFHPVTDRPIHIDFRTAEKGKRVKVHVKIRFFNKEKSPGLKKGGFLNTALRTVSIMCDPDLIPHEIALDVGSMKVGDKIKTIDLPLPEGATLTKGNRHTVASILGRGVKDDAGEVTDGEEVEDGEEDSEDSEGEETKSEE